MYSTLLRDLVRQDIVLVDTDAEQLKMVGAIHRVIPPRLSYTAIAGALQMLLVSTVDRKGTVPRTSQGDRNKLIKQLRSIIRALATHLGPSFSGCLLVEALQSCDICSDSLSARDEEDKARLMFQCVTVSVSPYVNLFSLSDDDIRSLRESLNAAKKLILTWWCSEYGPHLRNKEQRMRSGYFISALGLRREQEEIIPPWLSVMRCLLFLDEADSPNMKTFMIPGGASGDDDSDWEKELPQIRLCCEFGGDFHEDLVWILLKSSSSPQGIDSEMTIQLLEHTFEKCSRIRKGKLIVSDTNLVLELYNLVHCTPDTPVACSAEGGSEDELEENGSVKMDLRQIPRYDIFASVDVVFLACRDLTIFAFV